MSVNKHRPDKYTGPDQPWRTRDLSYTYTPRTNNPSVHAVDKEKARRIIFSDRWEDNHDGRMVIHDSENCPIAGYPAITKAIMEIGEPLGVYFEPSFDYPPDLYVSHNNYAKHIAPQLPTIQK